MMNLTILPSRGAKPDFGGKPLTKADFESDPAGAKGLAPPGSAPPPKRTERALGEEGAIREPNAPTQDLDFSPKIDPKNLKIDSEEFALNLESAFPVELPEEAELPIPLPKDLVPGFSLAAVAVLGPIVVPAVSEPEQSLPAADPTAENVAKSDAAAARTAPILFGKADLEPEPVESKDPPRLIADVCPAAGHPRGEDKGISGEASRPRPPVLDPEAPGQKSEAAPANGLFSRKEHLEKLAGAEIPPIEAVQEELAATPVPVKPESEREAALKLKAGDQHTPTQKAEQGPIPANIPTDVKPNRTKAEVKSDEPKQKSEVKVESVKEESITGPVTEKSSKDASDSLLKRRSSKEGTEIPSLTFDRADAKSDVPTPVPVQANPVSRAIGETKAKEAVVPELGAAQRESVIRQVVDRVESLAASSPRRNVTIHLDPRDFGSITLVVKRNGSEVDTEIYASHEAVRHALENNKAGLQSGLEQRGIHLASMNIGTELPNSSGRQEQAAKEAAQQPTFSPRSDRNEAPTLTLDAMRNLTRRATGVDLWI